MNAKDAQVLIAGGGPVGMILALELAHHGVRSLLVERNPATTRHPKMDLTNGRSMELLRRLGIADDLRAVGVPSSAPLDIVWATSAAGHVLHRFAYPSPDGARDRTRVLNDGAGTIEPSMRVSQIVLEPVLKAKIDASPLVDVRFGWAYESHTQDADAVTMTIRQGESDATATVRGMYLAGCDGGGSLVRRRLGIGLEGQHAIAPAIMIHFRSTDYAALARFGIAYHLQTDMGSLIAQNGRDIWTLQTLGPPDSDPHQLLRGFVGRDFDYEILVSNPWTPHMVVADSYRRGRVFVAGDAAHQVVPTGGYGMNTGVGDAVDLGWKLGAVLNGWGGGRLLDSYEAERRPVALQNRAASARHLEVRLKIMAHYAASRADGPLDVADRRMALGRAIEALGNAENESWGIEHGYIYDRSSVICTEGPASPFDPLACSSGTTPGKRLPHFFLGDGRALLDLLGREVSLIVVGDTVLGGVESCANSIGMPLTIVRLEDEPVLGRLERRLLLVRPDQHVAWRADNAPTDWSEVLAVVVGTVHAAHRREAAA